MRHVETMQVGPRHAGHTRSIYAGRGLEMWHETMRPWNPLQSTIERVELFVGELPDVAPSDAEFCGTSPAYYGDHDAASIIWTGRDAYAKALIWIRRNRSVKRESVS